MAHLKVAQPSRVDPPPGVNANQAAISLMAMAETFRSVCRFKMAIKCCQTALRVPSSPELFSLCSYELGKLLWLYTRNQDLAQFHLDQSWQIMRQLGPDLEQARLKAAALLAELLLSRRFFVECLEVIRVELSDSPRHPQLHIKLLFLYAEAQLKQYEFGRALEAVQAGVQFSKSDGGGGVLVECYFRLVKSLILSIQMTDQQELGISVGELGEILQTVALSDQQEQQTVAINDIRAFCYSIQLCYFLAIGMVKSSKQCLRQLHITVQAAESSAKTSTQFTNTAIGIRWLNSEMLTAFAYVLTLLCNIQYSNFERAHRYHCTAIRHLEGIRAMMRKSKWNGVVETRMEEFMDRMEMLLYEGLAQLQLVQGNPDECLNSLSIMYRAIHRRPGYKHLYSDFGIQMHILLGFYATTMRNSKAAERQFNMAVKWCGPTEPELLTIGNLSLALIYLFASREADFYDLFDAISPTKLRSQANSLRSAAYLIHGFHYFLNSRHQECKKQLMDSVAISKEEDMARLQSMALLLLAKLLQSKEMLNAAYEWASKSNDCGLVLWANTEVISLSDKNSNNDALVKMRQDICKQKEHLDNKRAISSQMLEHKLLEWNGQEQELNQ